MTLMHTIVYISPYAMAHVSLHTVFKTYGLSRMNDSFNEVRLEKQMVHVGGVRQLFSSSHGGKEQRGQICNYLITQKLNHPHPDPPPSRGRE